MGIGPIICASGLGDQKGQEAAPTPVILQNELQLQPWYITVNQDGITIMMKKKNTQEVDNECLPAVVADLRMQESQKEEAKKPFTSVFGSIGATLNARGTARVACSPTKEKRINLGTAVRQKSGTRNATNSKEHGPERFVEQEACFCSAAFTTLRTKSHTHADMVVRGSVHHKTQSSF